MITIKDPGYKHSEMSYLKNTKAYLRDWESLNKLSNIPAQRSHAEQEANGSVRERSSVRSMPSRMIHQTRWLMRIISRDSTTEKTKAYSCAFFKIERLEIRMPKT